MKATELRKEKHAAGGFIFKLSQTGNTRYGQSKKDAIISALNDSYTEGVYQTTKGDIKRQLLNGNAEYLNSNNIFI